MKPTLCALAALALLGCGNWSNEDLAYLSALPTREALESRLPATGSAQQGLLGVRRDGLSELGARSGYYESTLRQSQQFNALVRSLLHFVEAVRAQPPTSRSAGRRVWGPFPDPARAGFEVRATMALLESSRFAFKVELRARGTAEWTAVLDGEFVSAQTLQRGHGELRLDAAAARAVGAGIRDLEALDVLTARYETDRSPSTVELELDLVEGNADGFGSLVYTSRETDEGAGSIRFVLENPTSPQFRKVEVQSRWREDGAGQADTRVLEGTYLGTGETECWNADREVVFAEQRWLGGSQAGDSTSCVALPEL